MDRRSEGAGDRREITMEFRVTTCDICNPRSSFQPPDGRGYFEGPMLEAKRAGWQAFRDGSGVEKHRCLECQEEEKTK